MCSHANFSECDIIKSISIFLNKLADDHLSRHETELLFRGEVYAKKRVYGENKAGIQVLDNRSYKL